MPDSGEKALLTILERLPLAVVITSTETGVIQWVNARNMHLAGATDPQQIVGRMLLDFLPPDQKGAALGDIEAIGRGESPPPVVYRLNRLDGGTSDVQIASVPMRFQGAPAVLSLVTDVSERERALRELEDSEERYRYLVETSPDGILVCTGETIVFVNATLVGAMRAERADDLVGRSILDFVDPGFRKSARERLRGVYLKKERQPPTEIDLLRVDGEPLRAIVDSAPIRWRGELAMESRIVLDPRRSTHAD